VRTATPLVPRCGSGLGSWRWVVERTFAWLHNFHRLLVRYDRRADIREAFLGLACVSSASAGSERHCETSC
jgi:transposase